MPHASAARSFSPAPAPTRKRPTPREMFFKRDHPRAIDRYIDYFGAAGPERRGQDPCGERFLDLIA